MSSDLDVTNESAHCWENFPAICNNSYDAYNSSMLWTAEFSPQGATLEPFFFFISSTLITFYDFNFHFLWEKQPFSRHPQLKTKKERKRRIYYSITLATVYMQWRSFTGHCGPWTLLLYCNRLRKQTNKQIKSRSKNQTQCSHHEFGACQKFANFVITNFLVLQACSCSHLRIFFI